MKKIILITAGMFAVLAGYSQTNKGNNAGNTGIVEPTINGKPYSQHKAEQDAIKAARANRSKVVLLADGGKNASGVAPNKIEAADKKSEMGNPVKVVEVKPALISKEEQQNAPVPARLTLSKNSTTSNSKGTPPVEKVAPVNRTTEEAVGNNGTAAAVDASKTKVEPAKTAEVSKSAIPADIKLVSGANAEKAVKEEAKAEPVANGDKKMSDSRKQD